MKKTNCSKYPRYKREIKFMDEMAIKGINLLYCPYMFYFIFRGKKTRYTPDFYDPKENKFYELVGTRQRWHQCKDKLSEFQKVYKYINFEIVKAYRVSFSNHYKDNIIGEILNHKKISMGEYAKGIGLPQHTINHIYNETGGTSLVLMDRVSRAMGVSIDEMPYMKKLNKLRDDILKIITSDGRTLENKGKLNRWQISCETGVFTPSLNNFLDKKRLIINPSTYEKLSNYLKKRLAI